MFECPSDKLVERVHEQLALTDRCEKRERGHDRLGRDASLDWLGDVSSGETPQSPSHGAELCRDRCFRERRECAKGADAELTETAMRVGVERQNGDGLRSEELLFFTCRHNNRFARLGAACRDPSGEFPHSPTHTCGVRRAAYCFDDLFRSSVNSLESITPHINEPQLSSLDDRTHLAERCEQTREALVVVDRVRFDEPQRGAESNEICQSLRVVSGASSAVG